MAAPRDPRDRLPPFLAALVPDPALVKERCRLWVTKCYSFLCHWFPRLGKACARGWSALDRTSRLFVVCAVGFVVLTVISASAPQFRYTITDLGTLGGELSDANALNNCGQVVGDADADNGHHQHAFLWQSDTGMKDLGTLGGQNSRANGINDRGQVVGDADTTGRSPHAFGRPHAFLWQPDHGMQDLGTLGKEFSVASAINSNGQIVGWYGSEDCAERAFLWQNGSAMQDLGYLGSCRYQGETITAAQAYGINDLGQVVGSSALKPGADHAFVWGNATGMQDLGTLGGENSSAAAINNRGQIVGNADGIQPPNPPGVPLGLGPGPPRHALLWQIGKAMRSLGIFAENWGKCLAISKDGTIVGFAGVGDKMYAFICSGGRMTDLNALIDPASGWHLRSASAINDSGQIVGNGQNQAGQSHAFLLTPVSPQSSLFLPCLVIVLLLALGWRLRGKFGPFLRMQNHCERCL